MSDRKLIKIDPDFLKINKRPRSKYKKNTRKTKRPDSNNINPGVVKDALLKRMQIHTKKEREKEDEKNRVKEH